DTLCQVVQVVVDGVEEESGKRIAVNVSPNPVSRHGQIALDVHLPGAGAAEFVLRDMPGREALRVPLYLTDGRTRQSVSLGSLPAGVYIAALETEKKTVWTEKVLVY
ncbi:MAG: T9SS type A sorting domain-containing protein, partial [Saprospiraceae bacterium]|nr:T9SS type A sorting domain-containing protein [Saprospiraceae bacterium]